MFERMQLRAAAVHFAGSLINSIYAAPENWTIRGADLDQTIIATGSLEVIIRPHQRFKDWRMADQVRVTHNGADVWLPWFRRRRLRLAVRHFMVNQGYKTNFMPYKEETC